MSRTIRTTIIATITDITITTADITICGITIIGTRRRISSAGIRQTTAAMARAIMGTMTVITTVRAGTATILLRAGTRARFTGNGAPAIGAIERRLHRSATLKQFF